MARSEWVRVYVPEALLVVILVAGASYACQVGEATEENATALATKAEAAAVEDVKRDVTSIRAHQTAQAEGINWIGDSVHKIAKHLDIDLEPRPIVPVGP